MTPKQSNKNSWLAFASLVLIVVIICFGPGLFFRNCMKKPQVSDSARRAQYEMCIPESTGAGLYYFYDKCGDDYSVFGELIRLFMEQHPNLSVVAITSQVSGGTTYAYYVFFEERQPSQ